VSERAAGKGRRVRAELENLRMGQMVICTGVGVQP